MHKLIAPIILTALYFAVNGPNSIAYHIMIVYVMLLYNIIYAISSWKKRFIFFMFQFTMLTFLLGQPFAEALSKNETFQDVALWSFSNITQEHTLLCVFISLVSCYVGYIYSEKKEIIEQDFFDIDSERVVSLRYYSKRIMYICSFAAVLSALEKAIFVMTYGYVSLYTNFSSALPGIFDNITAIYKFGLYLFLATMPSKQECKVPIGLYLLIGIITLGSGHRGVTILTFLFVIFYSTIRDSLQLYGTNEIWLTKRNVRMILIGLPFLLVFLTIFGSIRLKSGELESSNLNFIDSVLSFFHQQGGSLSVIAYGYDYDAVLPDGSYTFGFLKYVFRFGRTYSPVEIATSGCNFGAAITYTVQPDYYLRGGGLGSCYIAEVFKDFGYAGVVIINLIYGYILGVIFKIVRCGQIWKIFASFVIITQILYAPRAEALSFVSIFLSLSFVFFVLLIHTLMRKVK